MKIVDPAAQESPDPTRLRRPKWVNDHKLASHAKHLKPSRTRIDLLAQATPLAGANKARSNLGRCPSPRPAIEHTNRDTLKRAAIDLSIATLEGVANSDN
ncbi:MAG: hypothetical protein CM1200mP18_19390 [Gammaproteobacteria bacterium]|nr:MAG: hypothetical protein CM1200mP18_19390 [Gammaproteobacteria bacterium]